jgi:hypothetical protein
MKKTIGLLFFLLLEVPAFSQYQKMLDVLEDTETEEQDGKFTLRFFNALNGEAVSDASVSVAEIGDFTSDPVGRVKFDIVKDGNYSFKFSKGGFISAVYSFEVVAGTIFNNRFSVCPRQELGATRIVLDWDRSPADLDLHLVKKNAYHISYRDKIKADDGSAWLDRDDTNGWGPETVSISQTDNGAKYSCFVHDYSNQNDERSSQLSKSKAVIWVYNNNELVKIYRVPTEQKGNTWLAFSIQNGSIQDDNIMGSIQP